MTPNNAERTLAGILALLLVAPAAAGAAAEPRFQENSKRYELENDDISVWFQRKKPLLKVFPTDNESRSYQLHMHRVVEFQDADGDDAYDESEAVAFVSLARADAYNVSKRSEANAVHFELSLNTTLKSRGSGGDVPSPQPPLGDGDTARANVSLAFHVYGDDRTLETTGGNVTVDPGEVKYDIEVDRWDWTAEDSQLAFVGQFPAGNGTEAQAQDGEDRVSVQQNGTEIGYTTWQDQARIDTGNGTETVDVVPSYDEQENGTVQVALAYSATAYDSLLHDPTSGVTTSSTSTSGDDATDDGFGVPGLGVAAAMAAIVGAAAARRRRF
jgi:hypothetical protein